MHTASNKWRVPKTKYTNLKKKQPMQMMRDKRHLASDRDRAPKKTSVKKKLNNPVDISESDEFIMVHTSFFCNFLREKGTDFWPKDQFLFYRFKLFFSLFSTQKPIPNVKIFI